MCSGGDQPPPQQQNQPQSPTTQTLPAAPNAMAARPDAPLPPTTGGNRPGNTMGTPGTDDGSRVRSGTRINRTSSAGLAMGTDDPRSSNSGLFM
jgi:hypothetical protein